MKFEAKGICKSLGEQRVLDTISLSITSGEIVGLLGPNGAGKSTAIKIFSGEIQPDQGEIVVDGASITELSASDRAKLGIRLFRPTNQMKDARWSLQALVAEGGTKLLILDEPLAAVDSASASLLKELLLELRKNMTGILVSDFNARRILEFVDRAYVIYDGRILAGGPAADFLK